MTHISKRPDHRTVVVCSGTSWDGPHLSDRHLAERLVDYAPVLWVDPPISWLTPLRRRELASQLKQARLREVRPGLMRLTPVVVPGVTRPVLRVMGAWQTRRAMRRATRRMGRPVAAVVIGSLDDYFGACGEEKRLLWGTDDFAAGGELMGVSSRWLEERERDQLAKADVVCAVSHTLAEKWAGLTGKDVAVIPNGCDTAQFAQTDGAPRPSDVRLPSPIAAFVGHLSERIDLAYLEAVAQSGTSLLLVGPVQETFDVQRLEALFARPNVQWVGAKAFSELPSYLSVAAVGLTPYRDTAFNRASFPLKTLEYLAAGLPVVSTDLPSARSLETSLVQIANTPEDFARVVGSVLSQGTDANDRDAARSFASGHDWEARVAEIASLIGLKG